MTTPMSGSADVLIVGAGNAALVAALSAHEQGARVAVLEAAPATHMGGNSRYTLGGFRFGFDDPAEVLRLLPHLPPAARDLVASRSYSCADYLRDLLHLSRHEADPALCQMLADDSLTALHWLTAQGVGWELSISGLPPEPMWRAAPGNVYVAGRGKGLVAALRAAVESRGIPILYRHRLERILLDGHGCVRGLLVDRAGSLAEMPCRAVVLACGGFEANAALRREHLGEAWAGMKVRGTAYNTGGGLTALLEIGARTAGQWSNGHAVPVASDAPETGLLDLGETTRRCLFQYGVSVNRTGARFLDEGADRKQFLYSTTGLAVAAQVGGSAYQIFDARLDGANFEKAFYFSGTYHKADTLADLAGHLAVPAEAFLAEVVAYNAAVVDESRFDPTCLDGSAAVGLAVPRSNYAARIVRPPFYAFEVVGGITFTYGGVAIDTSCRVLNQDDEPLPGVYAAGEITGGFFAHTYPANAGLMRGAVTGRRAGAAAARD